MLDRLATDPGVWPIIWWTLLLLVVGGAVLFGVTTLLLRTPGKGGRGPEGPDRGA